MSQCTTALHDSVGCALYEWCLLVVEMCVFPEDYGGMDICPEKGGGARASVSGGCSRSGLHPFIAPKDHK